jgi:hypothetical protein
VYSADFCTGSDPNVYDEKDLKTVTKMEPDPSLVRI